MPTAAPTVTRRQPATDATTALRRLVAESVLAAAEANGIGSDAWLDDVRRLQTAVAELSGLRRSGAAEGTIARAREQAALAMLMVMPVYRDARDHLDAALEQPDLEHLQGLRAELGRISTDLVDPWLHRTVTESVNDVLDARTSPVRLAHAA